MSHITHLLCQCIADYLESSMITGVSSSDPARASVVKTYRFQDDPIVNPIAIVVIPGNPVDTNYKDGRIDIGQMEDLGLRVPSGEIGGGHLWWRRGRVTISCFFITQQYDQNEAGEVASIVRGRVENYVEQAPVSGIEDDYGEKAHHIQIYASTLWESGGPPNQYIWRGEVFWQVLTQRDR